MANPWPAVHAFAQARWGLRFASRDQLLAWQQTRIRAFIDTTLPRAAFYADRHGAALESLPIVDKRTVLGRFADFNTHAISLDRALDVAQAAERSRDFVPTIDGLTVGLSSGTSGTRGVFLVSAAERQQWAGLILARLLSAASLRHLVSPWQRPLRIAFSLRANSNLYETVASRRVQFGFHDLLEPLERHVDRLNAAPPDILIAPPTVLHRLADAALAGALRIAPTQIVSVAEVIEPDDRDVITRAFGAPIQEVYQATEGFLAATCSAGRLHLNEEFVHIEPEWLDADHRRFRPIVTDFTRTTQLIVRYRLDDVLRVSAGPCACGRVTRVLDAIEGRSDDVLWCVPAGGGRAREIFPDVIRRSMALSGAGISDYRIEQHDMTWQVHLSASGAGARVGGDVVADAAQAVTRELQALCTSLAVEMPTLQFEPWLETSPLDKRRRIRCVTKPTHAESVA